MTYAVKVPIKDTEKVKKKLMSKKLFNHVYEIKKSGDYVYIPVKEKIDGAHDVELKKIKSETKLKNLLKNEFTKEEMSKLKTSYDLVGSIAILEIDDELKKKAKTIASYLLESNKKIKTVLMKHGIHEGEFRTQKLKYVAGEKTKETIYRENNVGLMLDVEKVYFSPRLSTERKRIYQLVKPDEDILVMFSGCAPYPCVMSKNTDARNIYGIELNPFGHRYGVKNVKLNKLHNVILINGDVKEVVKNPFYYLVGLKSSRREDELQTRLIHHPVLMELHLFEKDLFDDRDKLEKTIQKLKDNGIQFVLYMPFGYDRKKYYFFILP